MFVSFTGATFLGKVSITRPGIKGDTQAFWHQCQSLTLACVRLTPFVARLYSAAIGLVKEQTKVPQINWIND